jgi:hypothetical protein
MSSSATSSTTPVPVSPRKQVTAGTSVKVTDGLAIKITDTGVCEIQGEQLLGGPAGGEPVTTCKDVTDPNMRWDGGKATIGYQSWGNPQQTVVVGEYQGSQVPARIDLIASGQHFTATVVSTPGMKNWRPYYAVIPQGAGLTSQVGATAYDASGKVITSTPMTSGS